ncbi:MAG TPA: hypothetical protein VG962_07025 [Steroidobacteraceae bacterium]|nr:hypothetical protein [Steroidobacteraceae bacterium]
MCRTLVALTFLSLSISLQAQPAHPDFLLRPETSKFEVLGMAKGTLMIKDKTGCVLVAPVRFSRPQSAVGSVLLTSLRFRVTIPNGRKDWKPISISKLWPLKVKLTPKQTVSIDYAMGCMDIPDSIVDHRYWLFMEIDYDDSHNESYSAYLATKEYWKLIDVPK